MAFLTNDKLVIVGAAGMIGSNMAQTALMMGLTNDICLYDVFSPEGVAEEMRQSGFDSVKITATTNAEEAFKNAKYMKNIFIYDPKCEICAGSQTIPANYIDVGNDSIISHQERKEPPYSYFYRTLIEDPKADADEKIADTVIHGFKGSTAEVYAEMYGIKFMNIEQSGDVNADGEFNVADLVMMSRYIYGMTTFEERQIASADLNGDGNVDIFDMVEFRKKILESLRD